MPTADQYRAKADAYRVAREAATSAETVKEARRLEQSYRALADNEDWLVRNADKVGHFPQ